jgi:cobalt-zinc-cadmium efflux system protein
MSDSVTTPAAADLHRSRSGHTPARPETHIPEPDVSVSRLLITMALNFAITLAEIAGGLLSGSLSLISDALHNFSDGIAIIITYLAIRLKRREKSLRHTFGLKRAEILAAVINAAVLLTISLYLFYEAAQRLSHPAPIQGGLMAGVALLGLAANVVGTLLLRPDAAHSLNVRSAYLHLLSDAASSVGVVLGGLAVVVWRVYWVDPILTLLIGLYVLRESFRILSQAIHVLMEGAPPGIDLQALRDAVEALPEVDDIHHLHVWTVGENDIHLEAHLNVRNTRISEGDELRRAIETMLRASFGINHTTIQLECGQCRQVGLISR